MGHLDAMDEVRVMILTGAGERAFCAGAELAGNGANFIPKADLPEDQRYPGASASWLAGKRWALNYFESPPPPSPALLCAEAI